MSAELRMRTVEDAGDALARPKLGIQLKLDIQPKPGTAPRF
jgi:hypothetical protein